MKSEKAFFEELAKAYDHWLDTAVEALGDPHADTTGFEDGAAFSAVAAAISAAGLKDQLRLGLAEVLRGLLHSALVTLDNGTALAESVRLSTCDQNGNELGPGLHEGFLLHLAETNRL